MNEINYPSGGSCAMTLAQDDYGDNFTNYKSTSSSAKRQPANPLRRRTKIAILCWSSLLIFALACLCVSVVSFLLIPQYRIKLGIPILLVGAGCCGVSIFCFYTSYNTQDNSSDVQFKGDMSEEAALSENQEEPQ